MNKLVIVLACLVAAAAAYPQGYGSNNRGSRRPQRQKQCKTIYDVEYVDKLEKECDTKYM